MRQHHFYVKYQAFYARVAAMPRRDGSFAKASSRSLGLLQHFLCLEGASTQASGSLLANLKFNRVIHKQALSIQVNRTPALLRQ
jgi:hypothetical protein